MRVIKYVCICELVPISPITTTSTITSIAPTTLTTSTAATTATTHEEEVESNTSNNICNQSFSSNPAATDNNKTNIQYNNNNNDNNDQCIISENNNHNCQSSMISEGDYDDDDYDYDDSGYHEEEGVMVIDDDDGDSNSTTTTSATTTLIHPLSEHFSSTTIHINSNNNNSNNDTNINDNNTTTTMTDRSENKESDENNENNEQQEQTKKQQQHSMKEHVRYESIVSQRYPNSPDDDQFPSLCPSFAFPTNTVLQTLEYHWFILTDNFGRKLYGYVYPLTALRSLIILSPNNYPLSFLRLFDSLKISNETPQVDLQRIYELQDDCSMILSDPVVEDSDGGETSENGSDTNDNRNGANQTKHNDENSKNGETVKDKSPEKNGGVNTSGSNEQQIEVDPCSHLVPYLDIPLFPLIDKHSTENLAYLYRHVLLENSILVITPHPNLGVLFIESIKNLLFPFVWPHVEIPVANISWTHFLEAPVPFMMAITCQSVESLAEMVMEQEIELCENCVVFDIVNDVLYGPDFSVMRPLHSKNRAIMNQVQLFMNMMGPKLDSIRKRGKVNVTSATNVPITPRSRATQLDAESPSREKIDEGASRTRRLNTKSQTLSPPSHLESVDAAVPRPVSLQISRRQRSTAWKSTVDVFLTTTSPWSCVFGLNREIQFAFLTILVTMFQNFEFYMKRPSKPSITSSPTDDKQAHFVEKQHLPDFFDLHQYLKNPRQFDPHLPHLPFLLQFNKTQLFHVFIQKCEISYQEGKFEQSVFRRLCRASVIDTLSVIVNRFHTTFHEKIFKRGQFRKSWKKRDFVLERGSLTLKYFAANTLKGSLLLEATNVERISLGNLQQVEDSSSPTPYGIIVTTVRPKKRTLFCCTDSLEAQQAWFDIFHSRTFLSDDGFAHLCQFYQVNNLGPSSTTCSLSNTLSNMVMYESGEMGKMLDDSFPAEKVQLVLAGQSPQSKNKSNNSPALNLNLNLVNNNHQDSSYWDKMLQVLMRENGQQQTIL